MFFKTNYRLMQVKSISECSILEHSAIILTFIKLPVVVKTFDVSILAFSFVIGFILRCKWIMTMSVLSILMHLINLSQVDFTNYINKRILI